jgi:hypothetical protein
MFPVTVSILSIVRDKVAITSVGLAFFLVRGVKIDANASSVTATGKLFVREMGRWSEKKSDAEMSKKILVGSSQIQP